MIPDAFTLRVGFEIIDVIAAKTRQRSVVGADRALDFALDDFFVLLLHDTQEARGIPL